MIKRKNILLSIKIYFQQDIYYLYYSGGKYKSSEVTQNQKLRMSHSKYQKRQLIVGPLPPKLLMAKNDQNQQWGDHLIMGPIKPLSIWNGDFN